MAENRLVFRPPVDVPHMPRTNPDLHGNAPDKSPVALILIDVINDLDFPEGDQLLRFALPMAERLAQLKQSASKRAFR